MESVKDIKDTTVAEMTKRGCGQFEIKEYLDQIKCKDYWEIKEISQEYLDEIKHLPIIKGGKRG